MDNKNLFFKLSMFLFIFGIILLIVPRIINFPQEINLLWFSSGGWTFISMGFTAWVASKM